MSNKDLNEINNEINNKNNPDAVIEKDVPEKSVPEKKKYPFVKTMLRTMPIQFKATPWHNLLTCFLGVLHGLSFTVSVIATKTLFDAIAEAAGGTKDFRDCLTPLLILAGITFGQQILNGVANFHIGVIFGKTEGKVTALLYRKLLRIFPAQFEETEFLDDLNKAREGAKVLPYLSMTLTMFLFFYIAYFGSIGAYLFSLKPILLITLLVAFIPALLAQLVRVKVFTKLEEQNAPLRREYEYYQKTMCDREYFKETRILGAFKFFHKLFSETMILLTGKTWQAERKTAILQTIMNLSSFAGMAIASYLLFSATMAGEITVGAFAAIFATLGTIFSIMQEIITYHLGNMSKDIGKVANYIRMLDLPEYTGVDGNHDFTKGVVAENISFSYPGRETPAVNNVSLSLAYGETVAVVGENGAGKSTLVRLLTGVYRPSEGKVSIGGLDSTEIDPSSIFQGISGVFQKYQRYKMTLGENVAISDIKPDFRINSKTYKKIGLKSVKKTVKKTTQITAQESVKKSKEAIIAIEAALHEAHAELDEVELDTMLSPEFDGIDLSGGQWQRLAIARGLYRKNDFIVLDEPTAAIDPIEETRVYTQFQKLAEGKCAVIVTHRLGSAKLAHRIIVMDAGEIVDSGTHDELLSRKGKYADMWSAQAQWYEREPDPA